MKQVKYMVFKSRITIDRKSKIITVRLRNKARVEDIQIHKKLAIAYDAQGEVTKIYLLPFSLDEFFSSEIRKEKNMASVPALG